MLTYASTLKSITSDRGTYHMEFDHYEEVPAHLQEKIIAEYGQAQAGRGREVAPWHRDFVYIEELGRHVGESVTLKGWLYQKRSSGQDQVPGPARRHRLPPVRGVRQGRRARAVRDAATAPRSSRRSCVRGTVRKDDRAPGGFELGLEAGHGRSTRPAEYPIQPKEHGVEFLFDHRHLYLRSRTPQAVLKVRSEVVQACRDFFYERGFVLIDSPILTPAACEGTTTLFETDYFGDKAYLTQSGQLYLEPACMAFGRVYCFGPTFRAEKSKTRRHLTEFWMIEPEVALLELPGLLELAEEFVAYVVGRALDRCREELKFLERDTADARDACGRRSRGSPTTRRRRSCRRPRRRRR